MKDGGPNSLLNRLFQRLCMKRWTSSRFALCPDSVLISRAQLQCAAVDVSERNKKKRKRGRERKGRETEGNSPAVKDALSN